MDDQNPGSARSDRDPFPAATNVGGATKKPPGTTALSKVGDAAQQAGSQAREKASALAAEAGEKAKGFVGNQVEGFAPSKPVATVDQLSGPLDAANTAEHPGRIKPERSAWRHEWDKGTASFTFAPRSLTVIRFE